STCWFDDIHVIRQSNMDNELHDGLIYGCPLLSRLSSGRPFIDFSEGIHFNKNLDNIQDTVTFRRLKFVNSSNTISVSSALNEQGSIIAGQAITLSFSFDSSSITITWSGQSLLRKDTSTLTVPASGGSPISYTGLSAGTGYYIYLRINATTGAITAVNGSPPPTSPSSTLAA